MKSAAGRAGVLLLPFFILRFAFCIFHCPRSTRTVGGELDLYSALPPWGSQLPLEVDRANLEDAEQVVAAMAEFSRGTATRIVFSLNDEDMGSIDKGVGDRGITVGLLGEWRRVLDAKS